MLRTPTYLILNISDMKNSFFFAFCFLLFLPTQLKGQDMLKDGNLWSYWTVDNSDGSITTSLYKVDGDTIINDISYKKIYHSSLSTHNEFLLENYFLRSTDNGKVFRKGTNQNEVLLMDINRELGDSFITDANCELTVHHVRNKILNNNNIVRQNSYTIDNLNPATDSTILGSVNSLVWLENVGNIRHPFLGELDYCPTQNLLIDFSSLVCFVSDGEFLLGNEISCSDLSTSTKDINKERLTIYPNPFVNFINIGLADGRGQIESISILGVEGKEIRYINKLNSNTASIEASNYASGFYFINILTSNGETISTKLVKY